MKAWNDPNIGIGINPIFYEGINCVFDTASHYAKMIHEYSHYSDNYIYWIISSDIVLSVRAFVLWYENVPANLPIMHPHPPQEPSADKNNNRRRFRLKSTSRERTETPSGMVLFQYYLRSVYYSGQWTLSAGCIFQRIMNQFI